MKSRNLTGRTFIGSFAIFFTSNSQQFIIQSPILGLFVNSINLDNIYEFHYLCYIEEFASLNFLIPSLNIANKTTVYESRYLIVE